MKFSEMIRIGAAKTKSLRNGNLAEIRRGEACACAIGAAATAKHSNFPTLNCNHQMEIIEKEFSYIMHQHPTDAEMKGLPYLSSWVGWTFYAAIGRMNDEGVLTREEIADWLEKIGR